MDQEHVLADMEEIVSAALHKAYQMGQLYWQQADSDYASENRKSSVTSDKFLSLVADTRMKMCDLLHDQSKLE